MLEAEIPVTSPELSPCESTHWQASPGSITSSHSHYEWQKIIETGDPHLAAGEEDGF